MFSDIYTDYETELQNDIVKYASIKLKNYKSEESCLTIIKNSMANIKDNVARVFLHINEGEYKAILESLQQETSFFIDEKDFKFKTTKPNKQKSTNMQLFYTKRIEATVKVFHALSVYVSKSEYEASVLSKEILKFLKQQKVKSFTAKKKIMLQSLLIDYLKKCDLSNKNVRKNVKDILVEKLSSGTLRNFLASFTTNITRHKKVVDAVKEIIKNHTVSKQKKTIVIKYNEEKELKDNAEAGAQNNVAKWKTLKKNSFCDRFARTFDDIYAYFKVIHSGKAVSSEHLKNKAKMKQAGKVVSGGAALLLSEKAAAIASGLINGSMMLANHLSDRVLGKQAGRLISLFNPLQPSERVQFIDYIAEQIFYKYEQQIYHLVVGSKGIDMFADCLVTRIVDYINDSDENVFANTNNCLSGLSRSLKSWWKGAPALALPQEERKMLDNIFLDGIVRYTSEFYDEKETLQTESVRMHIVRTTTKDQWSTKGIIEATGLKILSKNKQIKYFSDNACKLELYGYALGTLYEADKRLLKEVTQKGRFCPLDSSGITVRIKKTK